MSALRAVTRDASPPLPEAGGEEALKKIKVAFRALRTV